MGQGYEFNCKCGYSFTPYLGVGFMFPSVYRETVEAARKGKLGRELETFFSEHPDGAIDAEVVTLRCKKCGKYKSAENLAMYLPNGKERKEKGRWSVAMVFEDEDYVDPSELQECYKLYAEYPHKCDSCGGEMEIISEDELEKNGITCPGCGRKIKSEPGIMWD